MNHNDCFKRLEGLTNTSIARALANLNIPDLYLVGGAIRNTLLDLDYNDFDLIVGGSFPEALTIIQSALNAQPHRINTRFNTARFFYNGNTIDVTQMHPQGITADLNQRENTISAFALRLRSKITESDLMYPDYAISDLSNLILRVPTPGVMLADPVRVLRVWRFAEEFGATVYGRDLSEIFSAADKLHEVSRERITEELWKALELPTASAIIKNWYQHNALFNVFPELQPADGCEQNKYHHLDVLQHTLYALEVFDQNLWRTTEWGRAYNDQINSVLNDQVNCVSKQAITRLALLLHDIGKPTTKADKNGIVTFYEHDRIGSEIAGNIGERYKFSSKQTELVGTLIKQHMRIGFLCEVEQLTPRMQYRYWRALDEDGILIILLNLADRWASLGEASTSENKQQHIDVSGELLRYKFNQPEPTLKLPLDGNDVMQLTGLKPGAEIGKLLKLLHEAVAVGEISSRDQAEIFIKENANN